MRSSSPLWNQLPEENCLGLCAVRRYPNLFDTSRRHKRLRDLKYASLYLRDEHAVGIICERVGEGLSNCETFRLIIGDGTCRVVWACAAR